MYRIIVKYNNEAEIEEVASDLSYGELCQYLLDCFKENKSLEDEELIKIENELYEKKYKPLNDSLKNEEWLVFDEYKLRIEVM